MLTKGFIYEMTPKHKMFQDESTGAHFEFYDLCRRLQVALRDRVILEEKLNLS
jgi:hypothetical protein